MLEENITRTLQDAGVDKDVLEKIPEAQLIKVITDTWDCIKPRSWWTAKRTLNKVKRQLSQ